RWSETLRKEGQQLAQRGVDLRDLDLSGRDLSTTGLSYGCLDRALLYRTDLSSATLYESSMLRWNAMCQRPHPNPHTPLPKRAMSAQGPVTIKLPEPVPTRRQAK